MIYSTLFERVPNRAFQYLLILMWMPCLGHAQTKNTPLREVILTKLQHQPKVTLELFVMSQCPYGIMAEELVITLVQEFNKQLDFKLQYIVESDDKGQLRSLHGTDELSEDLRQLVIAEYFPAQWLNYLLAHAKKNYRTNNWQASAQQAGIDIEAVERLMRQPESLQLLNLHSQEVRSRKIYASPSVFVDGQAYTLPLKGEVANCANTPPTEIPAQARTAKLSVPADASYLDGPIEIKARVREINVNTTPTDAIQGLNPSFAGYNSDEYSFKLWMNDKYDIDATGWLGGQLLTHDFNPPGSTSDFNHTFYQHSFLTNSSPKLLNIKIDAWEDEQNRDSWKGLGCFGTRGTYDTGFCCGGLLLGECLGPTKDDDNRCLAAPFISDINYRLGAPGAWYDHGLMTGTADANNFYKPHIETYWRYTKGTSIAEAIELGTMKRGQNTAPINTTATYGNSFITTDGNDVIYHFTNPQRALYDFSLCSGTSFDTRLYLLDNTGAVLNNNDDFCGTKSAIMGYDLPAGDYYMVVSGKTSADNGLFTLNISSQGTIFVKTTGNDDNDGTAWSSAFQTVQKALSMATPSNPIWVAAGTYYPTTNPTDRTASFVMKNGVAIYGGFTGTETNLNERNWTTNPTILSGDIDHATDPLVVTGSGSTLSITGNGGNSYHVIFNDNNGLNSTAMLDGFTITGGCAFVSGDVSNAFGGGMYNNASSPSLVNCSFLGNLASGGGGGMHNQSSSPSVSNCRFLSNWATNGGGMHNQSSSPSLMDCHFFGNSSSLGGGMKSIESSSPRLVNCRFTGNYGEVEGGGMYNLSSSLSLTNCNFSENKANRDFGGGMYSSTSSLSLINCSFLGNQVYGSGGAMFNLDLLSSTFTNCIFLGNQAVSGGGMLNWGCSPSLVNCALSGNSGGGMRNIRPSSPSLKNCILWGNSSEMDNNDSNPTYTNTLVKGLAVGGFQGTENPLFVNQPSVGLGTAGDLHLRPCSPMINIGNNADNTTTTDLDGNARIFNSASGGTIDLGSYEYQSTPPPAVTPVVTSTSPTTCGGTNGSISLSGFLNSTTYSVTYKKNTSVVAAADFTSNESGVITLTGLGTGSYTDIVATYGACANNAATASLTEPTKPSFTLSTVPDICAGAMSFTVPYTNLMGTPNSYSISGAGINPITDGAVDNPINVNLSSPASGSSILFTLTFKNSTNNCVSDKIISSVPVNSQPVSPTLNTKTPNVAAVCFGTSVSASFNAGSGGVGCSDDYVLMIDGGSPVAYSSGTLVGATANSSIVIQGRRANCSSGSGCNGTSYVTLASWTVNPLPTATISGTTTVCQNSPSPNITFTGANATAPYTFTYKINDEPLQTVTTTSGNSVTVAAPTGVSGSFVYTLMSVSESSSTVCSQTQTGSVVITVQGKPTITLSTLQQTLTEGNNQTLCDTDANPVNSLQFTVSGLCVVGSPVWRVQVGSGAWSDWSPNAPVSQSSNNQVHRYQAACDANCPVTYTSPIELTINYRSTVPQNVSLLVDGVTVAVGESKEVCSLVTIPLTFNANCTAGEVTLYSVDGGEYSSGVPTGLVDNQFHNYRVRCRKSDGTPSCVESESGVMRLKLVTIPTAPTVSLSSTSSCDATASFSGQSNCGSLRTVWYNASTNVALPNLPSTVPSATTSYYARCQTENGCVSERSNVVTFTLTSTQVAPVVTASQEIVCTGTTVRISANCPTGSQTLWSTGVTTPSFEVAFNNVTKQTYWAKCVFSGGCQSTESLKKDVYWNAFVVTLINIGESKSSVKTNDRTAWSSQFITRDGGPELEQSTQVNPTLYYVENANKVAPRYWTINVEACGLGTDGSLTFDMLATPEMGVIRSFNTHENNAPYFMYANREGWTELYAQNHPAYGFYQDNGAGGNVYDLGLPKGLYKLGIRYWDMKGWGSIYPSTRKPQGNVLAYQEYWFRIQSKDGVGVGAARTAESGEQSADSRFAQVMPNPVSTVLRLQVQGSKGEEVNATLLDVAGRKVLSRTFVPETHSHQEEFEVDSLPIGIYLFQVSTTSGQQTLKVVKVP